MQSDKLDLLVRLTAGVIFAMCMFLKKIQLQYNWHRKTVKFASTYENVLFFLHLKYLLLWKCRLCIILHVCAIWLFARACENGSTCLTLHCIPLPCQAISASAVLIHSFLLHLFLHSPFPPLSPTHSYYFNDDRLMHWPGACRVIMGKWTCGMHGPLTSILTLTATTSN